MPAAAASAVSQPSQPATELGSSGARELSGSSGREIMRSFATIREMLAARGMDTTSIDGQPMVELLARCGAERQDVFCVDIESCGVRVVYDLHPKLKMTDIRKQLDGAHQTYIVVAREKSPLSKTSTLAAASAASAAAAEAAASAAAASAGFHRFRFINGQFPAAEVAAIEFFHGGKGLFVIGHFHEAEAPGLT